ncbi:MAG: thymidylate synthase [Candidatus Pacebacteria bacterium]|nr:thymidylate synthase [Candidatus Paceibacterota bacterium]
MKQYLEALQYVLNNGVDRPDRTGVGRRAIFGVPMRFNLAEGFPAVTTKKLAFNAVKAELLWFLMGSSDNKKLQEMGCHIWDANAEAPYWKPKAEFEGDLGRVYGVQWRSWKSPYTDQPIDQLKKAIENIKNNPYDTRSLVSAWNPAELEMMALPPCHLLYHFFVANNKLSLLMYQRSCDMFLGVPFNIASYSLLLSMVAQVVGLGVGEFVHILGDAHIYLNHFEQVKEQLSRVPLAPPKLWLNPEIKDIDKFAMDDIKLIDYQSHPPIKAEMAV